MAKTTEATFTDFQRLEYVQIAPRGALVAISGRNKQGKSSVLDGLEATILGHKKRDVPSPVREGQKTAEITHKLDNGMILIRKYKADGSSSLTAKASDGSKVTQATLTGMMSAFGMSTGVFDRMDDPKQLAAVLEIVKLDFKPSELAAQRKAIFDQRTLVNGKASDLEAQVKRFGDLPDAPSEEVSVVDLAEQVRAGDEQERKQAEDHAKLEAANKLVADLEERLTAAREAQASMARWVAAHQPLPDMAALRQRMATAEETNRAVRTTKEKANLEFQLEATKAQANDLTQQIEALDKRKKDGLAAAHFPVEGMSFDDEGVLLNGRTFRKASTRERTIAAARLIIASDPEIRVMTVPTGSDLDSDGWAELEALGDDNDFQIWAEVVDESGEFGWTIEDGKVA